MYLIITPNKIIIPKIIYENIYENYIENIKNLNLIHK